MFLAVNSFTKAPMNSRMDCDRPRALRRKEPSPFLTDRGSSTAARAKARLVIGGAPRAISATVGTWSGVQKTDCPPLADCLCWSRSRLALFGIEKGRHPVLGRSLRVFTARGPRRAYVRTVAVVFARFAAVRLFSITLGRRFTLTRRHS